MIVIVIVRRRMGVWVDGVGHQLQALVGDHAQCAPSGLLRERQNLT